MKRALLLGLLVACLCGIAFLVFNTGRPIALDFCNGRPVGLKRVQIEGQGRMAVITDVASLAYLDSRRKLDSLPADHGMGRATSFNARLQGAWHSHGEVSMMIFDDRLTVELAYFKSTFSDTSSAFFIMDTNAPAPLLDAISFLMSETNRGKVWSK